MSIPSRFSRLSADGPVLDGIPEHGRVPRYYAVKVELLAVIAELGEGAVLPAERELCERFEVSRATVRQAVGELVLEGRLSRRQGSGTYVAGPKLIQPLALMSCTEGLRRQGIRPGRDVITLERRLAGSALASDLRVTSDAEVIHMNPALPMLLMHRVSWGPDGRPFERVRSLYRGDRLAFVTRLGRDR